MESHVIEVHSESEKSDAAVEDNTPSDADAVEVCVHGMIVYMQ